MKIKRVYAEKIMASNNKETIQITINKKYKASAPYGTSKGRNEVPAFKESIDKIINYINTSKDFKNLKINSFEDLKYFEDSFTNLIGNTMIAIEYALLKALSNNNIYKFLNPDAEHLPLPLGNCIGGGAHGEQGPDIQEFLLMPHSDSFFNNSFANMYMHRLIGRELQSNRKDQEGAWNPSISNEEALDLLKEVIDKTSKELEFNIKLGLDVAASYLYKSNHYHYKNMSKSVKNNKITTGQQVDYVQFLIDKYDLEYVEDPFHEEDFDSFSKLKNSLVCGDDLICTDLERLKKAVNKVNAVIIKPNQIGSLIKTKEIVCRSCGSIIDIHKRIK